MITRGIAERPPLTSVEARRGALRTVSKILIGGLLISRPRTWREASLTPAALRLMGRTILVRYLSWSLWAWTRCRDPYCTSGRGHLINGHQTCEVLGIQLHAPISMAQAISWFEADRRRHRKYCEDAESRSSLPEGTRCSRFDSVQSPRFHTCAQFAQQNNPRPIRGRAMNRWT